MKGEGGKSNGREREDGGKELRNQDEESAVAEDVKRISERKGE